jgi:hypothetical protein
MQLRLIYSSTNGPVREKDVMITFTVVQVRRDKDVLEWTVERSPHGHAYDLQGYYLSRDEADAEAQRLGAVERTRESASKHPAR